MIALPIDALLMDVLLKDASPMDALPEDASPMDALVINTHRPLVINGSETFDFRFI